MSNLSFSVLLAPYRVEYFNYIHKHFDCECYFQNKKYSDHLFTEEQVLLRCEFTPRYVKVKKIFGGRNVVWNLLSIIRQNKPGFIITPEFSIITIQLILLKLFFNYRLIIKSDDSYAMIKQGGFSKVHAIAKIICMPFADEVILCDKKTVEWYQEKYQKGIWLPIIQDERNIDKEDVVRYRRLSESYKEKYGLNGVKTILFVGRLVDVKNLPLLIESCSKIQTPYQLVIVGDGVMRKQWESMAHQLNVNAVFVGAKNGDELYAWYQAADVFVLPSTMEPFGAVTNEALLNGCNCVISDRAGSSCLIEEGVNGFVFSPSVSGDLVEKMNLAFQLPTSPDGTSKMKKTFVTYMNDAFNLMKERLSIQY